MVFPINEQLKAAQQKQTSEKAKRRSKSGDQTEKFGKNRNKNYIQKKIQCHRPQGG